MTVSMTVPQSAHQTRLVACTFRFYRLIKKTLKTNKENSQSTPGCGFTHTSTCRRSSRRGVPAPVTYMNTSLLPGHPCPAVRSQCDMVELQIEASDVAFDKSITHRTHPSVGFAAAQKCFTLTV